VVDGASAARVVVPGGNFLLTAEYHRSGPDLVLVGADGHQVVVTGFFASAHPPELVSELGGVISADLAFKLAGPLAPGQYAQANGAASQLHAIGTVDKASGSVTVRHTDGTSETLVKGGTVYQGDVLETGKDGSVGIIFADRTVFSLGGGGRMVMDDLVYDAQAHTGHSAFSVVQGTFSFVSGQIAKSGADAMTVKTPVMTIGIRGTTVAGMASAEGENNTVSLLPDPDGGIGQILISNQAGTQVLTIPNQTVQLSSASQAPPTPVVLPQQQLQQMYQSAVGARPSQPTQDPPIHNDPAPGQPGAPPGQTGQAPTTPAAVASQLAEVLQNKPSEDMRSDGVADVKIDSPVDSSTSFSAPPPPITPLVVFTAPKITPSTVTAAIGTGSTGGTGGTAPSTEPTHRTTTTTDTASSTNSSSSSSTASTTTASSSSSASNSTSPLASTVVPDQTTVGSDGVTSIIGGSEAHVLHTGAGNYWIHSGVAGSTIVGGTGSGTDQYFADNPNAVLSFAGISAPLQINLDPSVSGPGVKSATFSGFSSIVGGDGADSFIGGTGAAVSVDGAGGTNTISYQDYPGHVVNDVSLGIGVNMITGTVNRGGVIDHISNFQVVKGSGGDDTFFASAAGNTFIGNGGADVFVSGGGTDRFDGNGDGNDLVSYGAVHAAVTVDLGAGTTTGGAQDTLNNIDNLIGSVYSDSLTGTSGANLIEGFGGNDVIDGKGGADILVGGVGHDTFVFDSQTNLQAVASVQGGGNDTVAVNGGGQGITLADTDLAALSGVATLELDHLGSGAIVFLGHDSAAAGIRTVVVNHVDGDSVSIDASSRNSGITVHVEDLASSSVSVLGSEGADTIDISGAAGGAVYAGGGDDSVTINIATQQADGGAGNNTLAIAADTSVGTATFDLSSLGNELLDMDHGGPGSVSGFQNIVNQSAVALDAYANDSHAHTMIGGSGADTLQGGTGNDVLGGGAGYNTLTGGGGQDIFVGGGGGHDTFVDFVSGTDKLLLEVDVGAAGFSVQPVGSTTLLTHAGAWTYDADTHNFYANLTGGNGADYTAHLSSGSVTASDLQWSADVGSSAHGTLTGGVGADFFDLTAASGPLTVQGNSGDDTMLVNVNAVAGLALSGGVGVNDLALSGTSAASAIGVNLATQYWTLNGSFTQFQNVDASQLAFSTAGAGFVGVADDTGSTVIGSANGTDILIGGADIDHLVSISGNSTLVGGGNTVSHTITDTAPNAIIAGDVYVIEATPWAHHDVIENAASGIQTGVIKLGNGVSGSAIAAERVGQNLVLDLGDSAGGGTVTVENYFNPAQSGALAGQGSDESHLTYFAQGTTGRNDNSNILTGTSGNDTLMGGNNVLDDHFGRLHGSNDFFGGGGHDTFVGSGGDDTANFTLYHNADSRGIMVDLRTGDAFQMTSSTVNKNDLGSGGWYDPYHLPDTTSATQLATMVGVNNVVGTAYNDVFIGNTSGSSAFEGGAGDNIIINSGSGELTASYAHSPALPAYDVVGVLVNLSNVTTTFVNLQVDAGTALNGWGGTDTLVNVTGIEGSSHADVVWGGSSSVWFEGGAGADTLVGTWHHGPGAAGSVMSYQNDPSGVRVHLETDYYDDGDTVVTGFGVDGWGYTDSLINVNAVQGSKFDDTLWGADHMVTTLTGGAGNDTLIGGSALTYADYSNGGSTGIVANLDSVSHGGVAASSVLDGIATGSAANGLDSVQNIHGIIGTAQNDTFYSALGTETILGNGGVDTLVITGAANVSGGNNFGNISTLQLTDGNGAEQVNISLDGTFNSATWNDQPEIALQVIDGSAAAASLVIDASAYAAVPLTIIGGSGNDTLTGNGYSVLEGGGCADVLNGMGGDTLEGGAGNDTITGNSGDVLSYAHSTSGVFVNLTQNRLSDAVDGGHALDGTGGVDVLSGQFSSVIGSAGGDVLASGAGVYLYGMAGNNTLEGGIAAYNVAGGFGHVTVNLITDQVANAWEGFDTLSSVSGIIGSLNNDTFIANTSVLGDAHFGGGGGFDTLHLMGGTYSDGMFVGVSGMSVLTFEGVTVNLTGAANFETSGVSSIDLRTGVESSVETATTINLSGNSHNATVLSDSGYLVVDGMSHGGTLTLDTAGGHTSLVLGDQAAVNFSGAAQALTADFESDSAAVHFGDGNTLSLSGLDTVQRFDIYGTGHGDHVTSTLSNEIWVHPQAGGVANFFTGVLVSYDQSSNGGVFDLGAGSANVDGRVDTLSNLQGLVGTSGNDSFSLASGAGLSPLSTLDGGAGFDTLTVHDGSGGLDLSNVSNIEEVKFDAGHAVDIQLAYASHVGVFDFSALVSQNVTFDMSAAAGVPDYVSILGGQGDDTLGGSNNAGNYIDAGLGHNTISLGNYSDNIHATAGAVDTIYGFGEGDTISLDVTLATAGTYNFVDPYNMSDHMLTLSSGIGSDYVATLNLGEGSFREDQISLNIQGSTTAGNAPGDVIDIGDASGTINGGGGADTITVGQGMATVIWDNPDATTAVNFTDHGGVSTLSLAGHSTSQITMDLSAPNELVGGAGHISGFNTVDASALTGSGVYLHGSNSDTSTYLTMTGSAMADTLVAGAGGSVMDGHGGGDTMIGGLGQDNFVLEAPGANQAQALGALGKAMIINFDTTTDKLVLPDNLFHLQVTGDHHQVASADIFQAANDPTSTVQNFGQSGAALILVGDASTHNTHVWYTTDASHASNANSYQVATIVGVDPHSITDANLVSVAAAQQHGAP
jgi:Ca2+-binding RTX toxin-like protein